MKKVRRFAAAGVLVLAPVVLMFIAVDENAKKEPSPTPCDIRHAEDLWSKIRDYRNWPPPRGFDGWQQGKSPHGKFLRYYLNTVAREDLNKDGAVIVKANYTEKSYDTLGALTVMQKRKGYNPGTNDWFFVQYAPDGKVMTDDQGRKIAGAFGEGTQNGCVPCHATAGDDYLFMSN